MSLGTSLLRQCSKPSGWFGRLALRSMNSRHARVTAWGLSHVQVGKSDTILDVGCGGGMTIATLAAATSGKVGSVSQLPFPEATFDVVTAVETHYYWPNLEADMREVRRVLRPGGTFLVIAEAYKGGKYDRMLRRLEVLAQRGIMQYAHLTKEEHAGLFADAGFADVHVFENYDKGWLCAVGRKPSGNCQLG